MPSTATTMRSLTTTFSVRPVPSTPPARMRHRADEEVAANGGVAAFLQLARSKGMLRPQEEQAPARSGSTYLYPSSSYFLKQQGQGQGQGAARRVNTRPGPRPVHSAQARADTSAPRLTVAAATSRPSRLSTATRLASCWMRARRGAFTRTSSTAKAGRCRAAADAHPSPGPGKKKTEIRLRRTLEEQAVKKAVNTDASLGLCAADRESADAVQA